MGEDDNSNTPKLLPQYKQQVTSNDSASNLILGDDVVFDLDDMSILTGPTNVPMIATGVVQITPSVEDRERIREEVRRQLRMEEEERVQQSGAAGGYPSERQNLMNKAETIFRMDQQQQAPSATADGDKPTTATDGSGTLIVDRRCYCILYALLCIMIFVVAGGAVGYMCSTGRCPVRTSSASDSTEGPDVADQNVTSPTLAPQTFSDVEPDTPVSWKDVEVRNSSFVDKLYSNHLNENLKAD